MGIGQKRHRLTVQEPVRTQDPTTGELVAVWTTVATVWASIEPIRGRELLQGEQILDDMDTRLRIRWSPLSDTFTTAHRGIHQGSVFNFVSFAHVRLEQREIEIMAKSGVNDG